jgi:hypothetical protein
MKTADITMGGTYETHIGGTLVQVRVVGETGIRVYHRYGPATERNASL